MTAKTRQTALEKRKNSIKNWYESQLISKSFDEILGLNPVKNSKNI